MADEIIEQGIKGKLSEILEQRQLYITQENMLELVMLWSV